MNQSFEWVEAGRMTIWPDVDLGEVSEDEIRPGQIGVSLDTGSNGIMIYSDSRDELIAMAADLIDRLKAGEGASGWGEEREFVFTDGDHLVQDQEGDVFEAGRLTVGMWLRDNSGAAVNGDGAPLPILEGDTWQVMSPGEDGRAKDGQAGFIVRARKVLDWP